MTTHEPLDYFSTEGNIHAHYTDGPADEDAYRRGFQQGAHAAVEALQRGLPPYLVERWMMEIYRWRFQKTHKKRFEAPRAPTVEECAALGRRAGKAGLV